MCVCARTKLGDLAFTNTSRQPTDPSDRHTHTLWAASEALCCSKICFPGFDWSFSSVSSLQSLQTAGHPVYCRLVVSWFNPAVIHGPGSGSGPACHAGAGVTATETLRGRRTTVSYCNFPNLSSCLSNLRSVCRNNACNLTSTTGLKVSHWVINAPQRNSLNYVFTQIMFTRPGVCLSAGNTTSVEFREIWWTVLPHKKETNPRNIRIWVNWRFSDT